ncbi:O-antigen/teichoic acid export membrane protein [Inhella inkyongensis]|uniref:O-antigen/teichoic acid export membrane protein n=1 Tax=Inhella inkyongensis TaxID=392593 RepID=A0A840S7P8_9BURK|nr:oligosaccharide flippase family protein [Inhella inkyongensis]MBB5204470.1 O-antigen/teichoic acid export membrane protein [Inhella inkyongensis]
MIRDTLLYLGVRALNGIMALSTLAIMTRVLSPSEYGQYALGVSVVSSGGAVLLQWLSTAYSRFHSDQEGRADSALVSTTLQIWRALALALGVLASIAAAFGPHLGVSPTYVLAVGAGIVTMSLFTLQLQFASARAEPLRYGRLTVIRGASFIGLAAPICYLFPDATLAMLAFALAAFLACLLSGLPAWPRAPINGGLARQLFSYGTPQMLTFFCIALLDTGDRFIIASWHGTAAVAAYAAGSDLGQQTLGVLLGVVYLSGFSRAVRAWEQEEHSNVKQILQTMATAQLMMAGAACAVVFGLAPSLASLVFGGNLAAQAALIMPWIALATALAAIRGYLLDIPFQLQKRPGIPLRIIAFMALLNWSGNLYLVPNYGALGAAKVAAFVMLVGLLISYGLGRKAGLTPALGLDALKVLVCTAVTTQMHEVVSPAQAPTLGFLSLTVQAIAGCLLFVLLALLLNVGQLRRQVFDRLQRRML